MFGSVEVDPYTILSPPFDVEEKEVFLGNWKVDLRILTASPLVREVWVSVHVGKPLWEVENWRELYEKLVSTGLRRGRKFHERVKRVAYNVVKELEKLSVNNGVVKVSMYEFIRTVSTNVGVKPVRTSTNDGEYVGYSVEFRDRVKGFKNPFVTVVFSDFPNFIGSKQYYITVGGGKHEG